MSVDTSAGSTAANVRTRRSSTSAAWPCTTATSKPCRTSRCRSASEEITALIEPSGCGKSRCVPFNRMNDLIEGARVEGRDPVPRRRPLRRARGPGRGASTDRDGVPEAQPVPEVDLRQRRLRSEDRRFPGEHGRPRRGVAPSCSPVGRGREEGQGLSHGIAALGRSAAAPLHRARDRDEAGCDPDG